MAETQETQSTKAPVAAAETSLIEQMLKPLDIRPQDEVYSDAKRALEEPSDISSRPSART